MLFTKKNNLERKWRMQNIKLCLDIEKVLLVDIPEGENHELWMCKMVNQLIDKDLREETYLSTYEVQDYSFEWINEDSLIFTLVKKAIDALDLYCVHPDSYNEYDGESERIAKKIKVGMSIDEIAQIMQEEFNWSFSENFTREDFIVSAISVYNLQKVCSQGCVKVRDGIMKKFVYILIRLAKLISKKDIDYDNESEIILEKVSNKINMIDKEKSDLSSFSISKCWLDEV